MPIRCYCGNELVQTVEALRKYTYEQQPPKTRERIMNHSPAVVWRNEDMRPGSFIVTSSRETSVSVRISSSVAAMDCNVWINIT